MQMGFCNSDNLSDDFFQTFNSWQVPTYLFRASSLESLFLFLVLVLVLPDQAGRRQVPLSQIQ